VAELKGVEMTIREAFLAVTFKCNARCVMCDLWKTDKHEDLPAELYARLPRSLTNINITGGEPFLRRDLPDIVRVLHDRCGARMVISTHGMMTNLVREQMKEVLRTGARVGVRVSIDGVGNRHTDTRGVPGAFDKAVATLDTLRALGVRDLGVGFVATNHNVDQLRAVYDFAREIDVQFVYCGVAHNSEVTFSRNNPRIANVAELGRQLDYVTTRDLTGADPKKWFRALYDAGSYRHAATGTRRIPCYAGERWFYMKPNGDVHPDMILDVKFGNLRTQTFEEIWWSEEARRFRALLRQGIENCPQQCWMVCTVAPYMRRHALWSARWVAVNKLRAHLGLPIREPFV